MKGKDDYDYYTAALARLDAEDFEAAIQIASEGIQQESENELWYGPEKIALYSIRSTAYAGLDNEKAINDASTVISICLAHPGSREISERYAWRANLHRMNDDYDSAIADYTQAIEALPQHRYYFDRGLIFRSQGLKQEAIKDLKQAFELVDKTHSDASRIQQILTELRDS